MNNLIFGLELMGIGMVTVFAILLIVIYGSRLLISILNKIVPAEEVPAKKPSASEGPSAQTLAVLSEAVRQLTGGNGHITKVTEL